MLVVKPARGVCNEKIPFKFLHDRWVICWLLFFFFLVAGQKSA